MNRLYSITEEHWIMLLISDFGVKMVVTLLQHYQGNIGKIIVMVYGDKSYRKQEKQL